MWRSAPLDFATPRTTAPGHRYERRHSPEVHRDYGDLQLWQFLPDALDARVEPGGRSLLELPPVLHGQAEDRGFGRPRRPLPQEVRPEVRRPAARRPSTFGRPPHLIPDRYPWGRERRPPCVH